MSRLLLLVKFGVRPYAQNQHGQQCLRDYFRDSRFIGRAGNEPQYARRTTMYALISDHFYYFGRNAPPLTPRHREYPIERGGRHYRNNFPQDFIDDFVRWLEQFPTGVNGEPCAHWPEDDVFELGLRPGVARTRRCGARCR